MIINEPINQPKLFGLSKFFNELVYLYDSNRLPNKILLTGAKGLGKSTMIYHFINYVLSKNEKFLYDIVNFKINSDNQTFKTILNRSNPNFILIDINREKKFIDITQIRNLILNLNKSSLNEKPRFVLIDNIEFLNTNSINALLKTLEEPSKNVHFFLINNNQKILPTLLSRCINFKISLSNTESINIAEKIIGGNLYDFINKDLINYYLTPGNIYNLVSFAKNNDYDLPNLSLEFFLKTIINDNNFKKDISVSHLIFDFIEFYFNRINLSLSPKVSDNYSYFLKRISNVKKFNLDEESLFLEFENKILNA